MVLREELKDTIQYKQAVERYKRGVIWSIPIYMIILFVFMCLFVLFNFKEPDFNIFVYLLIFVLGEMVIVICNLFQLRNSFKVKEIFVSEKKIVKGAEETFYYCYEEGKKYKVNSVYLYQEIQQGRSYCFLCRGRKILEIIQ